MYTLNKLNKMKAKNNQVTKKQCMPKLNLDTNESINNIHVKVR